YVEIYNTSTQRVYLYDRTVYPYPPFGYAYTNTYHLRGEVDYNFPTNVFLEAGESLLVVNFALTNSLLSNAFIGKYQVPANVKLFGPYGGNLSDGGGTFQIEWPDAPQGPQHPDAGFVPYLRMDKARYDDDLPWPVGADGVRIDPTNPNSLGYCLVRKRPEQYGGEILNWVLATPTPGYHVVSNAVRQVGNQVIITFEGLVSRGYSVQYKNGLEEPTWQWLQDFPMEATSGEREVTVNATLQPKRFYRVVTPIQH